MGPRLGTLLLGIFFFLGFFVISMLRYNRKFNASYRMRNMFPYELNYESHFLENGYGNFSLILMCASSVAFFITFDLTFGKTFFIPVISCGILFSLLIPFICLVPLKNLKAHILLVVLEFALAIVTPASIGIAALLTYQRYSGGAIASGIVVASIVVCLFVCVLALNPSLSLRITMDKKVDENGETKYVRPKIIPLALAEWLLIISIFIDEIMIFILMLAL